MAVMEERVLFILQGIEETANETLILVKEINALLENTAERIKDELPKLNKYLAKLNKI